MTTSTEPTPGSGERPVVPAATEDAKLEASTAAPPLETGPLETEPLESGGSEPLETFQPEELGTPTPVANDPALLAGSAQDLEEPASRALRPTTLAIAGTAVVLTIVSAFVFDTRATIGVAVGGLLATVNFILFIRLVSAFLSQKGNTAPWAVLAGVKLLGLFAFVYIVLKRGDFPALALALGYGSLPIGISLGSLKKTGSPAGPRV